MKKTLLMLAAVFAFVACDNGGNPNGLVVDEIKMEDAGKLIYGDPEDEDKAVETNHTYSWKMDGTKIAIDINIDSEYYLENQKGSFEMGKFKLPTESFYEFTDVLVSSLDESTFVCYEPDGTEVENMTSYKPGMWVNEDAVSCGWGDGCMYWQWYVWDGKADKNDNTIGYDYDGLDGWMIIGTNGGNFAKAIGKTIVSKAKISAGGKEFDFVVSVKFSQAEVVINWDETPGETALSGEGFLKAKSDDFETTDGGEVLEWAPVKWNLSSEALNFEATYSISESNGAWAYGYKKFDLATLKSIVGDIDFNNFEVFYPLEADGETHYEKWTVWGGPGMWVNADGNGCGWSEGHMYWWLQTSEDDIFEQMHVDCAIGFGTNPGNAVAGESVTSKSVINGIPFNVTLHIVE